MVSVAIFASIDFFILDEVKETWFVQEDCGAAVGVLLRGVLDTIGNMCESLESCAWLPSDSCSWRDWKISNIVRWVTIIDWNELVYIILSVNKSDLTDIVKIKSACPNSFDLILSKGRALIGNLVDERVKSHFFPIVEISLVI